MKKNKNGGVIVVAALAWNKVVLGDNSVLHFNAYSLLVKVSFSALSTRQQNLESRSKSKNQP